jgi:hypothetical protein
VAVAAARVQFNAKISEKQTVHTVVPVSPFLSAYPLWTTLLTQTNPFTAPAAR